MRIPEVAPNRCRLGNMEDESSAKSSLRLHLVAEEDLGLQSDCQMEAWDASCRVRHELQLFKQIHADPQRRHATAAACTRRRSTHCWVLLPSQHLRLRRGYVAQSCVNQSVALSSWAVKDPPLVDTLKQYPMRMCTPVASASQGRPRPNLQGMMDMSGHLQQKAFGDIV